MAKSRRSSPRRGPLRAAGVGNHGIRPGRDQRGTLPSIHPAHHDLDPGGQRRLRELVDVAERALSPSLNDPTTAIQIVDQLHRILRPLVQRASPSPYLIDDHDQVRLVYRPQTVESLLRLAIEEITYFSRDSPPVQKRLRELLDDLGLVASPRYEPTVDALQRELTGDSSQ